MEVLAEMVTKAPTRVAIVEPCLGEPKDFEVLLPLFTLWNLAHLDIHGVFFTGPPPKISKYGKVNTLTF